jgi:hypothetical protein
MGSNKARIGLFAVVAICIVVAGCRTSNTTPQTTPEPTPAECNLEDIRDSEVFEPSVYLDAKGKNPTDEMNLVLYFDHELKNDEIQQMEQLAVTIYDWIPDWIPPVRVRQWHTYGARCKVEDICKLIDVDSIMKVESPWEEKDWSYPN